MGIRRITKFPEKVLGKVGQPVTEFDEDLKTLTEDMFETMYDDEGVGLAAPQIGLNLRLFVMDCEGIKLVAANPEIIETSGEQIRTRRLFISGKSSGCASKTEQGETESTGSERRVVRSRSRRLRRPMFSSRN